MNDCQQHGSRNSLEESIDTASTTRSSGSSNHKSVRFILPLELSHWSTTAVATTTTTGSICDDLLSDPDRCKDLTIVVGDSEQTTPLEHHQKQQEQQTRNKSQKSSTGGIHNSAGLWIIVWVINNLAITLTNKVAYNEPVDFKYPYFLSAHHMAFIALGTQFIFGCLDRQKNKKQSTTATPAAVPNGGDDETDPNTSSDIESDTSGSNDEDSERSKGSKELKMERQQMRLKRRQQQSSQSSWITTLFGDLEKKEL
eukprot:CAMPEP_0172461718 /NCGR_PEP_ID=MMETSP1065-20121228/41525_1 /TAXON_ID=265537 /ORGANISM="Amphiprora paludosa, Strain CCMP125" /LENGTH=254 /DNA_ID=CAMNT_0013217137 /DNA_START=38 /DNA_END=798 /DNA_ORIENTATION=-